MQAVSHVGKSQFSTNKTIYKETKSMNIHIKDRDERKIFPYRQGKIAQEKEKAISTNIKEAIVR
jgi:ABC-type enterochelin transport system ATPase subunit